MTFALTEYDEEVVPEGLAELGSRNHSYLQAKLTTLFFLMEEYTAYTELSLDVSKLEDEALIAKFKDSIKPDVAVYPKQILNLTDDILKMSEMPLLAIEILSPMQAVQPLVEKMKVYFALGVQSCWIVYPYGPSVTVYSGPESFVSHSIDGVIDTVLNIHLPLSDIFS